ncbi:hypothetical protein GALMADRAFT_263621 [Galerina marginata CBS 339.88]|uniref:C2H2-type domain-containing protein n=1 Tax=Galerina marginata (strain CBS 339.88) TaxID=685588 RepID=A0A067TTP1_GALM3|nr:hypothetical protein GALMADRAFT_263621 [Galerina marginata CBS 339.88]
MPFCSQCSYICKSPKTLAHHSRYVHLDRYWVLERKTGKVLFAFRRETPTSSLQCQSCTYSTKCFLHLCDHLKSDHGLRAFDTTTVPERVRHIPPPSNGVKVELKNEVKDVISIFDSDDDSDVVIVRPKKAQPTFAGRAVSATGFGITQSSRPYQKPSRETVAKTSSSSLKRAAKADVSFPPPTKRQLIQVSSPERSPKTETTVRKSKTEAMERLQRLETGLSDRCIVALIDLFQEDVSAADAYLALTREGVRKQWIADRVRHIMDDEEEVL